MIERRKQIRIVNKLVRLTKSGKVIWRLTSPPSRSQDGVTSEKYEVSVGDLHYVLYAVEQTINIIPFWTTPTPGTRLPAKYILEITAIDDRTTMEIIEDENSNTSLKLLYSLARRSISRIDDLLDRFVQDDDHDSPTQDSSSKEKVDAQ